MHGQAYRAVWFCSISKAKLPDYHTKQLRYVGDEGAREDRGRVGGGGWEGGGARMKGSNGVIWKGGGGRERRGGG